MNIGSTTSQVTGLFKYIAGDYAFLLVIFIILVAFTYYFGRGLMVSLILSFYPSTLLYKLFPYTEKAIVLTGDKMLVLNKIGLFLVFLIPIAIIINRFVFSASEYSGGENILRILGITLAFLVLVVLFSYTIVNYDVFHDFSPQIDALFNSSAREFGWSLAPILLLSVL